MNCMANLNMFRHESHPYQYMQGGQDSNRMHRMPSKLISIKMLFTLKYTFYKKYQPSLHMCLRPNTTSVQVLLYTCTGHLISLDRSVSTSDISINSCRSILGRSTTCPATYSTIYRNKVLLSAFIVNSLSLLFLAT